MGMEGDGKDVVKGVQRFPFSHLVSHLHEDKDCD
jgi:hypothetical protein